MEYRQNLTIFDGLHNSQYQSLNIEMRLSFLFCSDGVFLDDGGGGVKLHE